MTRNISKFENNQFDVVIIGGGIYGATLAWRASEIGLKVALVEKNDFASGTSSNSQKIIHGGIRYLQNLDFPRIYESVKSRKQLQHIAPHLVQSLKCVMPLYGHGLKGKEAVGLGFNLFRLLNNYLPPNYASSKKLKSTSISVSDYLEVVPELRDNNLSGGGLWHDGFCHNTEKFIIDLLRSANKNGAVIANYVSMTNYLIDDNRAVGIKAFDKLTNVDFEISGDYILDCSGPWINSNLENISREDLRFLLVGGINFVTEKLFDHDYAVAIPSNLPNDSRFYFVAPWKNYSIIGTEWFSSERIISKNEAQPFLDKFVGDFDKAFPSVNIKSKKIEQVHLGFVPSDKKVGEKPEPMNHYKILNKNDHGIDRLLHIVGVKYTTALDVSDKILSQITGKKISSSQISKLCCANGNETNLNYKNLDNSIVSEIIDNYGSDSQYILDESQEQSDKRLFENMVKFAVDEEMAVSISDIIYRRGISSNLSKPTLSNVEMIARALEKKYSWSENETNFQIDLFMQEL